LNRWFMTCVNQPQFKKVLGEVKLAETMASFDNKRYQELHPKGDKGGKAPKKDAPKKEKRKSESEKRKSESQAEEEPKPVKKVDPFAALPKPTMVFDEWKRMYSNNEVDVSFPWLWENLDREGYSFWHGDYQYNSEFRMDFMLGNLLSGMQGRIEGLRKNAFGVLLGFNHGDDKPSFRAETVWMFRGQQLAFDLNEDWNVDAPSFVHRKLDIENADDKQLIENFLAGENFGGREVFEYQCFK